MRDGAHSVQQRVLDFSRDLTKGLSGAQASRARRKGLYRICEKISLESRDESRGDVRYVKDCARNGITCDSMESITCVLDRLLARHHAREICIVRYKSRFEEPTDGGWADCMVNCIFRNDPTYHIFELQLIDD